MSRPCSLKLDAPPPELYPAFRLMWADGDASARPARAVTLLSGANFLVLERPGGGQPRGFCARHPPDSLSEVAELFSP